MILISNDRTSASKKIHGMVLIRTLTVSITAFERTKEQFYGFRRTVFSLAHKLNFAGHVVVTTGLRRMHFPRPGFFLRWNSNLQQVDFSQGFASNNILGLVVLAVNDGFLHLHAFVISPFFCLHFCHLEIQI